MPGRDPAWRRYLRVMGPDARADVDDEVRFHLETLERAFRDQGMSDDDARQAARAQFGDVDAVRRALHTRSAHTHRKAAHTERWRGISADARIALRRLARRPVFTLTVVGTLALGIGATTAIFSVVNPILFEQIPYPHAERVMTVWQHTNGGDRNLTAATVPITASFGLGGADHSGDNNLFGYATFDDIAHDVRSFAYTAAAAYGTVTLNGRAEPELLSSQRVSWTFFRVLGVTPALGRDFTATEDVFNAASVVILGNGLWRRQFGGDSTIIGRAITLNGFPATVVGVMPAGFESVMQPDAQLWYPLAWNPRWGCARSACGNLRVVARLEAGATTAQATQELNQLYQRLLREHPDAYTPGDLHVVSLREQTTRNARPVLLAMLGAVLVVLLIACVNVMNLLLAQGIQRRGEFAMRAALGAGRGRLVRQLLTESVVLATIGGLLGIAAAELGVRALVALSPAGLPRVQAITMNAPVLLFALVLTTAAGVAFGVVPALHAARDDLHHDIRSGSARTVGSARATRTALVVSEVALAFVLLIASGLLLRSLQRLFAVSPGFDPANVLTMQIQTSGPRFGSDSSTRAYFDRVLTAVRAAPGVQRAALTSQLPLSGDFDAYGIHSERHPNPDYRLDPTAFRYTVSDGYLEAMRIPVVRGRPFAAQDRAGQPSVALINETMARRKWWAGENPVGQRVRIGPSNSGPWVTVVGVVANVKQQSLGAAPENAIYLSERQPWRFADGAMSLVVRTRLNAAAMTPRLRAAIWSIDKDQPISRIATMDDLVARTAAGRRFALVLFETFALVALAMAAAGIYGVLSGIVGERLREIGVRAALGATRGDIIRMVLREGLWMTAVGAGAGLATALLLGRVIASLLFNTSWMDPVTYVAITALLAAVALAACWVPAWRAARVDPVITLRAE